MLSSDRSSPMRIEILPDEIVNQIAAGEVVENPSSVVKELVENSLDAGAQRIEVHLIGGGLQKILVQDDGVGMGREDLLRSLQRHATSKIRKFEDLVHLHTMGFRGEALASIAAVSKMKMQSASLEEAATLLYVEGGKVERIEPASRRQGTTIEVLSLFYNVPARKRFQKSVKASTAEVHRIMTRLALAYPQIGFSLFSGEERMIDVAECQLPFERALEKRVQDLFGKEFFSSLIPLSCADSLFSLMGFVGKPLFAKHNRSSQYLLINQRSVFSSLVDRSVREGYGTRLSDGFHPLFVLHLQIPPEMVDVNVHPQKREVRLRDEMLLKQKMAHMISNALDRSLFSPNSDFPHEISCDPSSFSQENCLSTYVHKAQNENFCFQPKLSLPEEKKRGFWGMKIVGSYYLVELAGTGSLGVIDLPGAYSRALFDQVEKAIEKNGNLFKEKQTLLVPHLLELSLSEVLGIEEKQQMLSSMGWEVRIVGKKSVAIDAIPPYVAQNEVAELFSSIAEELFSYGESEEQKRNFLKKIAERWTAFARSRKASYSMEEANLLTEHLLNCKDPDKDPLGRPIFVFLQSTHIQDLFLAGAKK